MCKQPDLIPGFSFRSRFAVAGRPWARYARLAVSLGLVTFLIVGCKNRDSDATHESEASLAPAEPAVVEVTVSQPLSGGLSQVPRGAVVLTDFGCKGDGLTDDSACFQKAVNASFGKRLWVPPNKAGFRISKQVEISRPVRISGERSRLVQDFPTDRPNQEGALFNIASDQVIIEGIWFDGVSTGGTLISGSRFAVQSAGRFDYAKNQVARPYSKITIKNCRFSNLSQRDANVQPKSLLVHHGIALSGVRDISIEGNEFDTLSGSAILMTSTSNAKIRANWIKDTGWGSIFLQANNDHFEITENQILGDGKYTRYWGGSIYLQGQDTSSAPISGPDRFGLIARNRISGRHLYGTVLGLSSSKDVDVVENTISGILGGTVGGGPSGGEIWLSETQLIGVGARISTPGDMTGRNPERIRIIKNKLIAGSRGAIAFGVVATNRMPPGYTNLPAGNDLLITGNVLVSEGAESGYFCNGIIVNGYNTGWERVRISNNRISARPSAECRLPGALGILGHGTGSVRLSTDISVDNNQIEWSGSSPGSDSVGIYLSKGYLRNLEVLENIISPKFLIPIQEDPNLYH